MNAALCSQKQAMRAGRASDPLSDKLFVNPKSKSAELCARPPNPSSIAKVTGSRLTLQRYGNW